MTAETRKLLIIVGKDEELINKIYEAAFKSGFEIAGRRRAVIYQDLTMEDMEKVMVKFKDYCQEFQIYSAKLMVIRANHRMKISFERIMPTKIYPKKEILLNGKDEDDLKTIINWIETKKPS